MEKITIDELIKSKKCLDMLHDGVRYELIDSIYIDTHDEDIREGINVLTPAIVEVFYAWLRHNNIKISFEEEE